MKKISLNLFDARVREREREKRKEKKKWREEGRGEDRRGREGVVRVRCRKRLSKTRGSSRGGRHGRGIRCHGRACAAKGVRALRAAGIGGFSECAR